jgi:hypothetical protein
MDVLRKMLTGAMATVRTELTTQMEEQGFIPAIFQYLKDQHEAVRRFHCALPGILVISAKMCLRLCYVACVTAGAFEGCCGRIAQGDAGRW